MVVRFTLADLFACVTCVGFVLGVGMLTPWSFVGELLAIPPLGWGMVIVFSSFVIGGAVLWWIRFGRE